MIFFNLIYNSFINFIIILYLLKESIIIYLCWKITEIWKPICILRLLIKFLISLYIIYNEIKIYSQLEI